MTNPMKRLWSVCLFSLFTLTGFAELGALPRNIEQLNK